MRSLVLSFALTMAFSAQAESDFCLAKEEIIPYSPFSKIAVDCNGKSLEVTALFGRKLQEKFEKKLKENDLKVILRLDNRMLVSKKSRSELEVNEICLVTKLSGMNRHNVECDNGQSLLLNSSSDEVVRNFVKSYNYNILQAPAGVISFYVLGR